MSTLLYSYSLYLVSSVNSLKGSILYFWPIDLSFHSVRCENHIVVLRVPCCESQMSIESTLHRARHPVYCSENYGIIVSIEAYMQESIASA